MSDIDEFSDLTKDNMAPIQPKQTQKLKPLYRQFTSLLMALFLTIVVAVGLGYSLFYQNNIQKYALEANQLIPLTQELKQIKALQKADELVSNLLAAANAENFVELHKTLTTLNSQLLEHKTRANVVTFQQWLNEYRLAEDTVSRLQDSYTRNQQLKQSSIIQLQLMILSIQPVINKQRAQQKNYYEQLQAEKVKNKVTYRSASAYAQAVQHLNHLQQLKSLFLDVLLGFEQLNRHTPMVRFEYLRTKVEELFALHQQARVNDQNKVMLDVNQQLNAFEKIVLTEQNALAKWQGYIRLAENYRLDLTEQQQKIKQLLATPHEYPRINSKSIISTFLSKFDLYLSTQSIIIILTAMISFSLYFFFFLLWQLRSQIKLSIQHSVDIIKETFNKPTVNVVANCMETQEIIQLVKNTVKPLHSELEFQSLTTQYQSLQQRLSEQIEKTKGLIQHNEQYELEIKAKEQKKLEDELRHYSLIETSLLRIIQQHQLACISPKLLTKDQDLGTSIQLSLLYRQLTQFDLLLALQSDKLRLVLCDTNLIAELYAVLFNEQREEPVSNNQLFIRCDEQLLSEVKIDLYLFQQLIGSFIAIAIADCPDTQLHLRVQLQDKSVGQQLVHFSAKVKTKSQNALPALVTELLRSQLTQITASLPVEVFSLLLAKQHGDNVTAQLVDDGYHLSFELPLATTTVNDADEISLNNSKIVLLANNDILTEIIEKTVLLAKGKFERLAVIESIEHYINATYLSNHKLDVLVISSDMAFNHLDYIHEKIFTLPHAMQPKLMVLQSKELSYERFGFYEQAEQIFCKDTFIENLVKLVKSSKRDNQLFSCEPFIENQNISIQLPILLGVRSPQYYQNLQRILQWLGLQVQVVTHETLQKTRWKTGQFGILITEFIETAFVEMTNTPSINIGVFSLTDSKFNVSNRSNINTWYKGKLTKESTLTELINALSPWIRLKSNLKSKSEQVLKTALPLSRPKNDRSHNTGLPDIANELFITQVADVYSQNKNEMTFDFSRYLFNQGSAELAFFMLDDYTQDNHQQLNTLIEAIKGKNIATAKLSIATLVLNANILAAPRLQILCNQWTKLLSGSEIPSSLDNINALIKETRFALNDIDTYAEAI